MSNEMNTQEEKKVLTQKDLNKAMFRWYMSAEMPLNSMKSVLVAGEVMGTDDNTNFNIRFCNLAEKSCSSATALVMILPYETKIMDSFNS